MNSEVRAFVRKVLAHYRKHGRTLPWRKTRDPYRILVSEMMLQQTQVERVLPFYRNFLKRFPDAHTLAGASLGEVLKIWNGLGYNRRAKFLHDAARIIARSGFPCAYAGLRGLPGVGDYTAKAVRVFAFDETEAMLETNIRTALIHEFFPRARRVGDEKLLPLLHGCLAEIDSPREWYWAFMDYGAFIKKEHGNATRRSKTYARQKKFEGSLRQVRGALLRELAKGKRAEHTLNSLGFSPERIASALSSLARDGLIISSGFSWRTP